MNNWEMWYEARSGRWFGACFNEYTGETTVYSSEYASTVALSLENLCCCRFCGEGRPVPNELGDSGSLDNVLAVTSPTGRPPTIKGFGYRKVQNSNPDLSIPMPKELLRELVAKGYDGFRLLRLAPDEFVVQYGKVVSKEMSNTIPEIDIGRRRP